MWCGVVVVWLLDGVGNVMMCWLMLFDLFITVINNGVLYRLILCDVSLFVVCLSSCYSPSLIIIIIVVIVSCRPLCYRSYNRICTIGTITWIVIL